MNGDASWSARVYDEFRAIANALLAGERKGHTLQPTALANEVWLRLERNAGAFALDRDAFLGLAARAMRRILTEHARKRAAAKRSAGGRRTTLDGKAAPDETRADLDLALDVDAALADLERLDRETARIVELRFYGGRDTDEIAAALRLSPRTVKRRWRFARAWLLRRLSGDAP